MDRHAICALVVLAVISSSVTSSYFKGKKKCKVGIPKTIRHDQCQIIVRSDCLHKSLPRGKRICVQLSDEILLQKLKDIGGYNPNYVAMTRKEAAKFKDPRLFETKQVSSKIPIKARAPSCNTRRRRPYGYRRRPYWGRRHTRKPWVKTTKRPRYNRKRPNQRQDEAFYDSIDIQERKSNREKVLGREKRSNHDDDDDSLSCWERGSVVQEKNPTGVGMINTTRRHLCGECQRTTRLHSNRIPRFINEALCKSHESISSDLRDNDQNCASPLNSLGVCKQRELVFPALELAERYDYDGVMSSIEGQSLYVEIVREVEQEISSGCECQVELPQRSRPRDE